MRRVVLDANILVSAFVTPEGVAGSILYAWEQKQFTLILSPYILEETGRILIDKIELSRSFVEEQMDYFYELAEIFHPENVNGRAIPDNDRPVLGTAVAGYASVLVTGDKELLALRNYQSIRIITPRKFLEIL